MEAALDREMINTLAPIVTPSANTEQVFALIALIVFMLAAGRCGDDSYLLRRADFGGSGTDCCGHPLELTALDATERGGSLRSPPLFAMMAVSKASSLDHSSDVPVACSSSES